MGLLDALLGRRQASPPTGSDAILAMGRASARLQDELGTISTGRVGIVVRPGDSAPPDRALAQVEEALHRDQGLRRARYSVEADQHDCQWVVLQGHDFQELVGSVGLAIDALKDGGLGEWLLAVVFPFTWKEKRLYWIYHPNRGRYTPFVPTGREQLRDYPLEVRMEAFLRKAIPTDRDPSQWFPLWDMPI